MQTPQTPQTLQTPQTPQTPQKVLMIEALKRRLLSLERGMTLKCVAVKTKMFLAKRELLAAQNSSAVAIEEEKKEESVVEEYLEVIHIMLKMAHKLDDSEYEKARQTSALYDEMIDLRE
eukprot:CAMPEP_0170454730 /NCGR_PEP_ID=MMETSP0123-20130129/2884_1 /TAXON_ID=182087 /ORGANISM="Favella ehrenbergii, Strain Fehren 1" /LENGTH=118 /DNA_ID=CAMNT_0010717539 /DNA_START=599 /DNA_END=954 /DNA_ORIENTATION=-